MKSPAFQAYPADWRKDPALQMCSIGARGLWWELICIMHESRPYGHLAAAGRPIPVAKLAQLTGLKTREAAKLIDELRANNVFSETVEGIIFSRRMVRDEKARQAWRERQKRHRDNPRDVTPDVTHPVTAMSPGSSSSSSSSSSLHSSEPSVERGGPGGEPRAKRSAAPAETDKPKQINGKHATRLPDGWSLPEPWRDWAVRVHHLDPQRVVRMSLVFRDHFIAAPGRFGVKRDWEATWRNWVRKEIGDA